MSAILKIWGEQIVAELSAQPIVFKSVVAGVVWYAMRRKSSEVPRAICHEGNSGPTSEIRRARAQVTLAKLALCTVPVDQEVDVDHDFDTLALDPRPSYRDNEAKVRVANLCAWYLCACEPDRGGVSGIRQRSTAQANMASELGMDVEQCERVQLYTQRVIKRRMIARKLLPDICCAGRCRTGQEQLEAERMARA